MRAGHISQTQGSPWKRGISSAIRSAPLAGAFIIMVFFLASSGCARKSGDRQSTPTSGSLGVYVSPSVAPLIQAEADVFNQTYPQANLIVYPLVTGAILDSLINEKTSVAYLDRSLSEAESLVVVSSRKHVNLFILGSTVVTWIVNPQNDFKYLDSLQLLSILTGEFDSWKDLGGPDENLHIYIPPADDGAWLTLQNYFGDIQAKFLPQYQPSDSLIIQHVADDTWGLGMVGGSVAEGRVKKLKWKHPQLPDPVPANIGTLKEGSYPFSKSLCYYTVVERADLAGGFLSFISSNPGQRLLADKGFLPQMIPVRIVAPPAVGDQN